MIKKAGLCRALRHCIFKKVFEFSDLRKGPLFRRLRSGPVPLEPGIPTSRAQPVRCVRKHEAEDEDLLRPGNGTAEAAKVVQGQQPPDQATGDPPQAWI